MNRKQVKNKLRRINYLIKWFFQYWFSVNETYLKRKPFNVSELQKTLILVPHADDEWIGNSQILSQKNVVVYYFQFLGNNYSESNKTIRRNELIKLKNKIGFELIVSDNYEDYSDLKGLLIQEKFSHVFLPFPIDWHHEHIKGNNIFQKIIFDLDIMFMINFYAISVPFPKDLEVKYIKMNKADLNNKQLIFSTIYQTQYNTPIKRLNYQLRLNAKGLDCYAAENYAELKKEIWGSLLIFVNENYNSEVKKIILSIDNLNEIRKESNKVFNSWINSKEMIIE